jgi:murein DD-endopeptidase MepM/ murein hydrolase activator NlpD
MRPKSGFLWLFAVLCSVFALWLPMAQASLGEHLWTALATPLRLLRLWSAPADAVLLMPVHGARVRAVADTWEAPRTGGRQHQGQDIFAPRDTPVRSATAGVVVRIADGGLGGKAVWVFGASGRRYYYAHLARYGDGLQVGDRVTTETILGYVGTTGNARTTAPHLHFGVFGATGPLDPLPLLRDREDRGSTAQQGQSPPRAAVPPPKGRKTRS